MFILWIISLELRGMIIFVAFIPLEISRFVSVKMARYFGNLDDQLIDVLGVLFLT